MRYDLDNEERQAIEESGEDAHPGLVPIRISPEQAKALAHAAESSEAVAVGFSAAFDYLADAAHTLDRTLVIDSYIVNDDGTCALGVNYAWNKDGGGAWLEADGGWHYQPGENGYYPWKEE